MRNTLVLQTWGIGDAIMTTPMLGALRQARPQSKITLLAYDSVAAQGLEGLVDEIRVIAPLKTTPIEAARTLRFFVSLRADRFDAAIVATMLAPSFGPLLRFVSGIPIVAGDSDPPKRLGYTHWIPRSSRHRTIANLDILGTLIPDVAPGGLYFHVDTQAHRVAARVWAELGLEGRSVLGIHPGSNPRHGTDKRPRPEMLRRLIPAFLDASTNARVAFVLGLGEEELVAGIVDSDPRVAVIANQPMPILGALVAKMRLVLAGDSGFGHVAAALGVPTVTVAGPTAVSTTHPWSRQNTIVRTRESLGCMPCHNTPLYGRCPYDVRCMRGIADADVMSAVVRHFDPVATLGAVHG